MPIARERLKTDYHREYGDDTSQCAPALMKQSARTSQALGLDSKVTPGRRLGGKGFEYLIRAVGTRNASQAGTVGGATHRRHSPELLGEADDGWCF